MGIDQCVDTNIMAMFSYSYWERLREDFMTFLMLTEMASYCMDIIQSLSEIILDVVLPQVYSYMEIYGTFSHTVLGLTEDRVHIYLGDSMEQALAACLNVQLQDVVAIKDFCQFVLRHISKTVSSVLDLCTQTPILESRLPVVFVSGCVTSIRDLKHMAGMILKVIVRALNVEQPAQDVTEAQTSQSASNELDNDTEESPFYFENTRRDFRKQLKAYIICMVEVLKSNAEMPYFETSNRRVVCIRVGANTRILTVDSDSEADGELSAMSSCHGLDAIPGAVPDINDDKSPYVSVTTTKHQFHHTGTNQRDAIDKIVEDLLKLVETDSRGLEDIDNAKLREFTDRVFNLVMSGRVYQIPLVPNGTCLCNTVICRKLRRGDNIKNAGIVAHTLYMRTEELVTRCAVQVFLWSAINLEDVPETSDSSKDLYFEFFIRVDAGEYARPPPLLNVESHSEQPNNINYEIPERSGTPEVTQSQLMISMMHTSLLTLMVGEVLTVIGIRNLRTIHKIGAEVIQQLKGVDFMVYNNFRASIVGESYKDLCQSILSDLLQEFGTVKVMQDMLTSRDPYFCDVLMRALQKQLSKAPDKKTSCCLLKKLKKLCCKKIKKTNKITPIFSATSEKDSSK